MAKRELELSPRLQLLADWVPRGARIVDVGTDHAYLPVWLAVNGRVSFAIASDLRKGPLERAKETGARYGAENVDYRLCNGLAAICPEEVDTISIAGMGGETIAAILEAAPWTRDARYTLLLSPHTKSEILREWLADNGYAIRRETLVDDRNTLYPVMEVGKGDMKLSLGQIWGGAKLLHDPMGDRYLIQRIVRLQGAVAGANRSSAAADREKADQTREVITALLEMREEWRHANGT